MLLDTPNMLRGEFYSTHVYMRCPSFNECPLCKQCRSYNPDSMQCVICEDRKFPKRVCTCTPLNLNSFMKIQEHKQAPIFSPEKQHEGVTMIQDGTQIADWDEIIEGLSFKPEDMPD